MAANDAEDDYELAYLRRQRATLDAKRANIEAQEDIDRREFELFQRKNQQANSFATVRSQHRPTTSHDTAIAPVPGQSISIANVDADVKIDVKARPTSVPFGKPATNGEKIDMTTPEPEARAQTADASPQPIKKERLDDTTPPKSSHGAVQLNNEALIHRSMGRPRPAGPGIARNDAVPSPARGTKRRRASSDNKDNEDETHHHSHTEGAVDDGKASNYRTKSGHAHRRPINKSFLTVVRTPDGGLAEYRCESAGCLANGLWKQSKFHFFSGISGLTKHYTMAQGHLHLKEADVIAHCVYHKLNEQEIAAVLAEETGGYKIEQVWAPNKSNARDVGARLGGRQAPSAKRAR